VLRYGYGFATLVVATKLVTRAEKSRNQLHTRTLYIVRCTRLFAYYEIVLKVIHSYGNEFVLSQFNNNLYNRAINVLA
jgi:hypothetical protein